MSTSFGFEQDFLTINNYSRSGKKLLDRLGIVMHWTGRANQNEIMVRNYFERTVQRHKIFASYHYIIGQSGKILQIIPDDETAYHCGSSRPYTPEAVKMFGRFATSYSSPNRCTIGIGMCPINPIGELSDETLLSASSLVKGILTKWNKTKEIVTTHHAVVGWKECPLYWVKNPEKFREWKETL